MKALLHIHPHFSHFIQSVVLAEKLFSVDSITVFRGPSFHPKSSAKFAQYLQDHLVAISTALNKTFDVSTFHWPSPLLWPALLMSNLPPSVYFSCRDSLLRGKYSHIYLFLPIPVRRFFELFLYAKAHLLYASYRSLIRSTGATLSISSHSTYMPYVTLIEASLDEGIPILVLYGAVDRAILIKGRNVVYHYACKADQIVAKIPPHALHPDRVKSTYAHPSSQYVVSGQLNKQTLKPKGCGDHDSVDSGRPNLLVLLHCLKDNNYTQNPSHMLFENYFDWTLLTCLCLALFRSNYQYIYIKVHPHASSFGDFALLRLIANIAAIGINSNKVKVLSSRPSQNDQPSLSSRPLVSLTFHGSVAYENASSGLPTLTVGDAPCPQDGYYRVDSKAEYFSLLRNYKRLPISFFNTLSSSTILTSRQFIHAIECMKPYPQSISKLILSLRRYFFFSRQSSLDVEHLSTVYTTLLKQNPQSFELDENCSAIIYL